ncbi:uncharacterized protein LOC143628936 [Bidens hawaiensis]|uniref:uncharacterized protein LOC143628936 n=1 Tax=Bidens hawaiensis TaxID=980011 RepID=UPI00404B93B8
MRRRREKWNESKEYNGSMILLAYAYANNQFNCVVENGKKLMAVKVFVDDDLTVLQDMLEEKRLGKVTIEKSAGKKITNQEKDAGDVDGGKKVAKFMKKELAKMVIRKHTKKTNQDKKFVESDQQEDGDKVTDVQTKQDFKDDNVVVVESEQHQEGFDKGEEMINMPTQTDEEERAERLTDLMQYFDNVYGDICREFDEAYDECAGSLLIKELEDQWKKNLARYTGKREDETGKNEGDGNGEASPIVMTQRTWESMERLCAKYESGSIKSTPQKKKVSFIVPDFNLESGVKKDDRETLAVIAKGKRLAEPDWEVNTPNRPQRFKFLSEVYCSPHSKRAVSLKATLTKKESKVAGFVFAAYGNHW